MPHPRCGALLRNGANCRQLVVAGEEFCPTHLALAAEYGDQRVRAGTVPRRRRGKLVAAVEPGLAMTAEGLAVTTADETGAGPADVRARLAEAAARGAAEIERVLLDACGATTRQWASFECPGCGEKRQIEVPVPDVRARLAAIELLLSQGLGKVGQVEEPAPLRVPQTVADIERLTTSELEGIVASTPEGAVWLIRSRLELVSPEMLVALRVALDELEREPLPERASAG